MENKMREIAKMFNVELGEEFDIKFKPPASCKATAVFTESGFNIIDTDIAVQVPYWQESVLHSILKGDIDIQRKPWKPKFNEQYYSIEVDGSVDEDTWVDDVVDYTFYKIGNCYRTIEEAQTNRNKWETFYSSEEVLTI